MNDKSRILKVILVGMFAVLGALFLGVSAATDQIEAVGWILGGIGLVACLILGARVWLLIPLMTAMSLVVPVSAQPTSGELGQVMVLAFSGLLILARKYKFQFRFGWPEFFCILVILSVAQVYARHPVGLKAIGSGNVGARAYVQFGLTIAVSALLAVIKTPGKNLKLWVRFSIFGALFNFGLGMVGTVAPGVSRYLGHAVGAFGGSGGSMGLSRIGFVRTISENLGLWLASRQSPIKSALHPIWVLGILISVALAGVSGFRSQVAWVFLLYALSILYYNGFFGLCGSMVAGIISLALLALLNLTVPLPPNVQRSLSFLPGSWDEGIVRDGQDSTDWRIEMWEEALLSDRWIENKVWGDGLGFTKKELDRMVRFEESGMQNSKTSSGLTVQQESFLIAGNYHSGPVHTVRVCGYIGLGILLLTQIAVAISAHRTIRRYWYSEWRPTVLFIALPFVGAPFFWWFIVGTYETGFTSCFMGAALLRMMNNNLDPDSDGEESES